MDVDGALPWKIFMGRAHFYLSKTVNTQNCRVWLQIHQMIFKKNPSTLQNSPCGMTSHQVSFFELVYLRVTAIRTCNMFGYCLKECAYVANIVVRQLQQTHCLTKTIFMQD